MSENLSEDEFRKALYESLSKKGVVSSFKSHLRQQLALQLSLKQKLGSQETNQTGLVSDMITLAHLKHSQYEYSVSTFISEANLSDKELNYLDWLRLLNVSEDSALTRALQSERHVSKSPLLSFLEAVVQTLGHGVGNAAVQTEAITLNDKLKIVDDKYSTLPADHFLSEQDKQLQNCFQDNKHVQEIVKLEVERFKELELERYKLVERDRVNKDFNTKLADYEAEYRQRMEGLHQRESESARIIDKMKSETEAVLFKERQALLSELGSLRSRSGQLEREHSLTKGQLALEQEKLQILTARLEEREHALAEKEDDFKNKLQEHTEKARLKCKSELREREAKANSHQRQLEDEHEEHVRTQAEVEALREELKKLRLDNSNLNDKLILTGAQMDAARSQALHYEAKLTVTADYEQIKNKVISMEVERRQLLASMETERGMSGQSERQLQDIITSLRDQLSRPSQTECDAVNSLNSFKHKQFNEIGDLKNQISKLQNELEREQKLRISAQSDLKDQFMECRSHHTSQQPKPPATEIPDFLQKYLSSVRLDEEEDISDHSTKLMLSDTSVSSDSIIRPTKSIVAGSRKLFDQLELEEQQLEREFTTFVNSNPLQFGDFQSQSSPPIPNTAQSATTLNTDLLKHRTHKTKSVNFAYPKKPPVLSEEDMSQQSTLTPTAGVFAAVRESEPEEVQRHVAAQGSTTAEIRGSVPETAPAEDSDILKNLDPMMQQYLNRVMKSKETKEEKQQPTDDSSHVEQVEFDKTDSDFSW